MYSLILSQVYAPACQYGEGKLAEAQSDEEGLKSQKVRKGGSWAGELNEMCRPSEVLETN